MDLFEWARHGLRPKYQPRTWLRIDFLRQTKKTSNICTNILLIETSFEATKNVIDVFELNNEEVVERRT